MTDGARPALAGMIETGWWWGAAAGVWLLTLSSVTWPELAAALACGLPCGLAARAGRHAMRARWRARPGWCRWLVPLPAAAAADTGRVLLAALAGVSGRRRPGQVREVALTGGEAPAVASARRAIGSLVLSFTPGTFVLDTNLEDNMLVTHCLASGWPRLDRVVRR